MLGMIGFSYPDYNKYFFKQLHNNQLFRKDTTKWSCSVIGLFNDTS